MTDAAVVIALGFVLGMRHATDADHVVAVATIVTRQRRLFGAALTGLAWGVGHTLTIVAVGASIILFNVVIPEWVSVRMELSVGVMLIALGIVNVAAFLRDGHVEPALASLDRRLGAFRAYALARPLVIGIVHGLAGSAAVALLVLATIHEPRWAMAYLVVFGIGTIAGMMLITTGLASAIRYAGHRSAALGRHLGLASGLASMAFGLWLVR
jgi:high-affinity nickel-transport protein